MDFVRKEELLKWCRIPVEQLADHPALKVRFRLVADSSAMGALMAMELVRVIEANNARRRATRAIIPCGPACWYGEWTRLVNERRVNLSRLTVFHMDECLDWQGRPLPKKHPLNFRAFMERHFYGGIRRELNVPPEQRMWLLPSTMADIAAAIVRAPVDITLGGWGQDGHIAYNQARRHPFSHATLEEVASSTIRIQENNLDTILALGNRNFGSAYQFVPPMSITLGVKECLSARKVRVFSDTGSWKQTALRVALFSEPVAEYPVTLLQGHRDAIITATRDTARHPISEHLEWTLLGEDR